MQLAFESVDSVKELVLSNVGEHYPIQSIEALIRTKRQKKKRKRKRKNSALAA